MANPASDFTEEAIKQLQAIGDSHLTEATAAQLEVVLRLMSTETLLSFRARCADLLAGTSKLAVAIEVIDRIVTQRSQLQ